MAIESAIETTATNAPNPDRGPRLLLLSSEFPPGPGGIGTHAYQLARHLTRLGWAVHVLSPQPYITAAEREAFNRQQPFAMSTLPEREGGAFWWAARLKAVRVAMRRVKPSILVATGHRALWMAAAIHSVYRLPWAAVGHGSEFISQSRANRGLTRRTLGSAAAVIAVSDYTAGLIRAVASPRRLVVIRNAADGDRFRTGLDTSVLRKRWGTGDGRVLLTVGQVSERKAQDVVIRALPRILAEYPDLVYVMAGLPHRQLEFNRLAEELGVAGRVRFVGLVTDEDLPAAYNLADLFVLVSRQAAGGDVEGYGIVVQEAALCGVPAIVSRDCGLTEAIWEGQTGISVPPDDPEATAEAILSLLDDEERRREMGLQAREMATSITWSDRIAEYNQLLRSLLTRQGGYAR